MSLLLTIVRSPENIAVAETTRTFTEQGGSLGRGADNDWVLQDPERYLSSRHCQISFDNGQFFLTDLSTNGTFVNGAVEPLGKGNRVAVNDGDTFMLGDYQFKVSLWAADAVAGGDSPFDAAAPGPDLDDPFAGPSPDSSPFGSAGSHVPTSDPLFSVEPEETDPLAALDRAGRSSDPFDAPGHAPVSDPFSHPEPGGGSHSDGADPLSQAVSWPGSAPETGGIPEDWDDDLGLSPAAPEPAIPGGDARPVPEPPPPPSQPVEDARLSELNQRLQQLEQQNQALLSQLDTVKQTSAREPAQEADTAADTAPARPPSDSDRALVDALGLADRQLDDAAIQEISRISGELMREMIAGLMQILSSRSTIKNEFRMSVTTIQPVENNPLKFSVNVDDALENMFIKKGNAYKKPREAVQEGFGEIAEHQMAVLAGIRAAFKGVIERFDPVTLEKRFDKQNKGGLIPGMKNARNWELFCDYYNEVVGDLDTSFQYLFGDDFVRAYEDQLQRLALARMAHKKEQ